MIQAVMYIALGLLMAGMLALLVTPAIWRRATRLTRQRIESSLPATLAEIQADKDQLRAEFAIDSRRLEMSADRLREKTTEQTFEINQKRVEIVRLTNERNQLTANIANFEQLHAQLITDLKTTEEHLSGANEKIRHGESVLATREGDLADVRKSFGEEQQLTAVLKREMAERNTEIENIRDRLADAKAVGEKITAERDGLTTALAAEQSALAAEHQRAENLDASLARIEAERIDRLAELERRSAEVQELVAERAKERSHTEDLTALVSNIEAERIKLVTQVEKRDSEIARLDELERRAAEARELGAEEFARERARAENFSERASLLDAEQIELNAKIARRDSEIARLTEIERTAAEAQELVAEELARERARTEDLTARVAQMDAEQMELSAQIEKRDSEIARLAELERTAAEAQELVAEELARERARTEDLTARASQMDAEQLELSAQIEKRDSEIARLTELERTAAEAQKLVAEELARERVRTEGLTARTAQMDAEQIELGAQIEKRDSEIARLTELERAAAEAQELVAEELARERARTEGLTARASQMDAERIELGSQLEQRKGEISRLAEFEQTAAKAQELVAELARERARREEFAARASELDAERIELGSQLDQREAEITRLTNSLSTADGSTDPKEDSAEAALPAGDNIAKAIAATEMENAALVDRLAKLEAEHANLSTQNDELRQKLSTDFDIDTENALLRERLTNVAADIVRLTRSGPDEEANTIPDKKSRNLDEDGAAERSDAAPSLHRRPTSVPVIKRPVGGANQPDGDKPLAEQMRAAPPTATRH